jgi:hypothetical protein
MLQVLLEGEHLSLLQSYLTRFARFISLKHVLTVLPPTLSLANVTSFLKTSFRSLLTRKLNSTFQLEMLKMELLRTEGVRCGLGVWPSGRMKEVRVC